MASSKLINADQMRCDAMQCKETFICETELAHNSQSGGLTSVRIARRHGLESPERHAVMTI